LFYFNTARCLRYCEASFLSEKSLLICFVSLRQLLSAQANALPSGEPFQKLCWKTGSKYAKK